MAALLFDLDGTLTNTDPVHFRAWQELLRDHGLDIDEQFYQTRISGRLNPVILQDLFPHYDEATSAAFADRKEAYFRELVETLQPMAGLHDVLRWLSDRALKTAVVTNAPRENAEFMLRGLGLQETFGLVVLAAEMPQGKPHPAPYRHALAQLGEEPAGAIAFEDSPSGIRSAVGAEIFTVGIASTHDPDHLYEVGAHLVVQDFTDPRLAEVLDRLYEDKALTLPSRETAIARS